MRLVRDLSRVKARKRSQHEYALVPLLFGRDKVSNSQVMKDLMTNEDTFDVISYEDLNQAKGMAEEDEQQHLWIAVLGHVFDVKEGAKFYAKGGSYEMLAGREATKALASGDLSIAKDFESDSREVKEEQYDKGELAEAQRWLEYFASHQKYKHIGRLPTSVDSTVNIDAIVNQQIDSESVEDDEDWDDDRASPPIWHPKVMDDTATCPGGGNS